MSDLDKKLIEILRWCKEQETWNDFLKKSGKMEPETGDYTSVEAACLVSLRQAFADRGYVRLPQGQVGKLEGVEIMSINGKRVMTGQEWYERFEKEYHNKADWIEAEPEMGDEAGHDVLLCAKLAAGIDHE